jgi:hypothetical protein
VLTRFDVSPNHWCHVTLVVHEASVEVWSFIWVGRYDVSLATREGILQEMEHGEELSGRPAIVRILLGQIGTSRDLHQHVITKPSAPSQYPSIPISDRRTYPAITE